MHAQLGEIMDKIQKDQKKKPTATSEELRAKAGYWACPLHSPPPEGWADHPSHPSSQLLDPPLPSPHVRNQLAAHLRGIKGNCYLFSLPPAAAGAQ